MSTVNPGVYRLSIVFEGTRRINSLRACHPHTMLVCATYAEAMVPVSTAEEAPPLPCDICRILKITEGASSPDSVEIRLTFANERRIIGFHVCHGHFHGVNQEFMDSRGSTPASSRTYGVRCDVCRLLEANRLVKGLPDRAMPN